MNILQDRYAYFFSLEDFPVGSTIDPIEHHFNEEGVKEKLEETLESIRKSKYRDFPSRLKGTFVAPPLGSTSTDGGDRIGDGH